MATPAVELLRELEEYKYGWKSPEVYVYKAPKGLNEEVVRKISELKEEPEWMLKYRLQALRHFLERPMPNWGPDLSELNFDEIVYYVKPAEREGRSWDEVPEEIKRTFERLGIPEAEQKFLAGVGAQFESEMVYHRVKEELERLGVIFISIEDGLKQYPELFREYFGKVVPYTDNKFAALNAAVWSGGSFVYIPPGVKVEQPLQAYFRLNVANIGQFERTLIIVDEGAEAHYVEGCTAPLYSTDSLHTGVIEIIVKRGARFRYTTIQNWSHNVYNLVTQRALVYGDAHMEWVDANIGCLAGDTTIYINNGVKPIAEIEPGDKVFALTENFTLEARRVVGKRFSGRRPVFRVRTLNHREILATANHPFLALYKEGRYYKLGWRRLDQLREGDYVAISGQIPDHGRPYRLPPAPDIPHARPIRTPEETTPELMWFLGFYLGDGFCESNRLNIAVVPEDPAYPRVVEALKRFFGVEPRLYQGRVLRVASTPLVRWLEQLGFGGTAQEKRVPAWVYTLPQDQREAFLQGYIAADGHVRDGHRNMSVTSVNRELLEDIKRLAISCGWNPLKISEWRRVEKKPLGTEAKEYVHYMLYFSDEPLPQPVAFSRVTAIEPAGEADTWDIEVEGAHNFVANGFIVHNSKVTMKYPSCYLLEPGAHGEILSMAFARDGQVIDNGGKVIHLAPNTTSKIVSKSVSKGTGRASYRGLVKVHKGAKRVKSHVVCDALLIDETSRSDTYPYIEIEEDDVTIGHEASVSRVSEEQVFYLRSRGLSEEEAVTMVVAGFIEPMVRELPMEYAVELNRLVQLEMEGSVG